MGVMSWVQQGLVVCAAATALTACQQEGPAERAGKKVDKAVEQAGDKVDKAAEKVGDALKQAGDKVKEATK
jgi:MT0933-like antitoxin protein